MDYNNKDYIAYLKRYSGTHLLNDRETRLKYISDANQYKTTPPETYVQISGSVGGCSLNSGNIPICCGGMSNSYQSSRGTSSPY